MKQGIPDYNNQTKSSSRNWGWNRIKDSLPVRRRDKTILYLCGPDDFDRECGRERSFHNNNLIAVDIDRDNIDRVRAKGGYGIPFDIVPTLLAWPADWPIHGIVADFCCGIEYSIQRFIAALLFSKAVNSQADGKCVVPVVVTLQRGRDKWSNELRDLLNTAAANGRRDDAIRSGGRLPDLPDDIAFLDHETKHRGRLFFELLIHVQCAAAVVDAKPDTVGTFGAPEIQRVLSGIARGKQRAKFNQYLSKPSMFVWMDQIAFNLYPQVLGSKGYEYLSGLFSEQDWKNVGKASRYIAATRAMRTMSVRNRLLKHQPLPTGAST